jgi:cell division protein FtsB
MNIPESLKKYLKNFYILTSAIFLIWMLFFDGNDLINQFQLYQKMKELEQEKRFYQKNIDRIEKEYKALEENPELLEKLAREKYLLKKNNEDVYIVE